MEFDPSAEKGWVEFDPSAEKGWVEFDPSAAIVEWFVELLLLLLFDAVAPGQPSPTHTQSPLPEQGPLSPTGHPTSQAGVGKPASHTQPIMPVPRSSQSDELPWPWQHSVAQSFVAHPASQVHPSMPLP